MKLTSRMSSIATALILFLCVSPGHTQQTADSPLPNKTSRSYYVMSPRAEYTLGNLRLNLTQAKFAKLKGRMELSLDAVVGQDFIDPDFRGSQMFRIVNADAFRQQNIHVEGFDTCQPRWLTVSALPPSVKGGTSDGIYICFMETENWRNYRPDRGGLCSCDSYTTTDYAKTIPRGH